MKPDEIIVGVISDTHGLLRKRVVKELKRSDIIVHAGDFDTPEVLNELRQMAPLVCARGNMDAGAWSRDLPDYDLVDIAGKTICVIHDVFRLDLEPQAAEIAAVISGHTHQPLIARQRGVLYFNPGSAGSRRSGKPVTMGRLILANGKLAPEIVCLEA